MKRWLCILILCLADCIDERSEEEKNKQLQDKLAMTDTTEITVLIPSKVSNKKLAITLPRCQFGFSIKNEIIDGKVEQIGASIIFALPTFSGFPNDEEALHQCPDFSKPVAGLSIAPLYPKIGTTKLEYGNFWLKQQSYRYSVKEQKNTQALYRIGIAGKLTMFVDQSDTNQQDFKIDFWPFDAKDKSDSYPHQTDIYSVLDKEFSVAYTVYSSRYLHGKHKPLPNQWYFADALIDIYKHNESLLDHPEIVQGFIENNNRILDYIHQHSKVVN
jgi:hypothetical protein